MGQLRAAFATALLAAAFLLAGCADGRIDGPLSLNPFPVEPASPASIGTTDPKSRTGGRPLRKAQVDLVRLVKRERESLRLANPAIPDPTTLEDVIAAVDGSDSPALRNNLIAAVIGASEDNCTVYLQGLRSGQVTGRLATDFVSGGLATAATLVTPVANSKILAGLSALTTATGSSVDRNIFAQQGAELVADAIVQLRAEDRERLTHSMQLPIAQWPFGLALADIFAFHGDCSMLRGFSRLRTAVLAREATIQSMRGAMAAAYSAGASRDVLVALVSGSVGPAPAGTADAPPSSADAAVLGADLEWMKRQARICLTTEVAAALTANPLRPIDAAKPSALKIGHCVADPGWQSRYLEAADIAFLAQVPALATLQKALKVELAKGPPSTTPLTLKAVEAVRDGLNPALAAYDAGATNLDAATVKTRTSILTFFDRGDGGRSRSELVASLTALYHKESASLGGDPALLAALGEMNKTPTGATNVTGRGRAAFIGYLKVQAATGGG